MKNYFGTDGIRFIYNEEVKTLIHKIGFALNDLKYNKIIIGIDTRFSSIDILKIIVGQLKNKVHYVGVCSTPCIAFLSSKYKCLGIMITASHNPYEYNGIKIFKNGFKISKKHQLLLSKRIDEITYLEEKRKDIEVDNTLINEYLLFVLSQCKNSKHKIMFDASNGSLSSYIDKIVLPINKNNIIINNIPNGKNINDRCGACNINNLMQEMQKNGVDYGFSFDGDADRVIMVYKDEILDGDSLIYILSKFTKKKTIVLCETTNIGLINSLKKLNKKVKLVPTGDYNILVQLKKKHLFLGGESSGHIIQYDKLCSGDGLVNAITIINLLNEYKIETLLEGLEIYPSKMVSFKLNNNESINDILLKKIIKEYLTLYKKDIHINVRISGTEDKVRVYVCYKDINIVNCVLKRIITVIKLIDYRIQYDNYNTINIDEKSVFGNNVILKGNVTIFESKINNNVEINNSYISETIIGNDVVIGPYSHIRNHTRIENNVRIGNFVEIKNSFIGNKCKIAHLTYIGDCECGSNVNFGCGVITCNYDGKNKNKTIIGNNVFIGSNSNLVAPLIIENDVFIAAGSTISKSLKKGDFVIARAKQIVKENKAKNYPFFQGE